MLNAARACAADLVPYADAFVAHGLPATFLADLAADIEDLERTIHDQSSGRLTHIGARPGIEHELEAGFTALRRLDAIVPNGLQDQPAALAAWQTARRVEWWQRHRKAEHV